MSGKRIDLSTSFHEGSGGAHVSSVCTSSSGVASSSWASQSLLIEVTRSCHSMRRSSAAKSCPACGGTSGKLPKGSPPAVSTRRTLEACPLGGRNMSSRRRQGSTTQARPGNPPKGGPPSKEQGCAKLKVCGKKCTCHRLDF